MPITLLVRAVCNCAGAVENRPYQRVIVGAGLTHLTRNKLRYYEPDLTLLPVDWQIYRPCRNGVWICQSKPSGSGCG